MPLLCECDSYSETVTTEPEANSSNLCSTSTEIPILVFDDGSRCMHKEEVDIVVEAYRAKERNGVSATTTDAAVKSTASLVEFYELNRIADEINALRDHPRLIRRQRRRRTCNSSNCCDNVSAPVNESLHIALQFPDAWLSDAVDVLMELERLLILHASETNDDENDKYKKKELSYADPLLFLLGDTSTGECCADVVAAQHLQADVLVHFGAACFSSSSSSSLNPEDQHEFTCGSTGDDTSPLILLYAFGKRSVNIPCCVEKVGARLHVASEEKRDSVVLLLYELHFHHAMAELEAALIERSLGDWTIVSGQLPSFHTNHSTGNVIKVGGLEIPVHLNWSSCILLYVGDYKSRQFLYMRLRLSLTNDNSCSIPLWVWDPLTDTLSMNEPNIHARATSLHDNNYNECSRLLKRRFYQVQKARQACTIGVLIANLGDLVVRTVVSELLRLLTDLGRNTYVYSIGKINVAKLSNFAEIDCFVVVACPDHSLDILRTFDRELMVPLVTPMEMVVALNLIPWGHCRSSSNKKDSCDHDDEKSRMDVATYGYSMDLGDFLEIAAHTTATTASISPPQEIVESQPIRVDEAHTENGVVDNGHDDDDVPFFSLVTGRYESFSNLLKQEEEASLQDAQPRVDLSAPPGQGVLTSYQSSAAQFLKHREYQGLQIDLGITDIHTAHPGLQGIASDYGQR